MSLERPNRMLTEDAVISSDNPNEGPTRQVDLKELLGETEPLPEDPTKAIEINRLADMEARIKASAGEQVQDDATRALELSERPSTLSDIDWDLD